MLRTTVAGACLLLLAAARPAAADGFDVRPVLLEAVGGGVVSLTVSNPGASRIYVETTVSDWSKDQAGRDRLSESRDAVASPPGAWVPAGAAYLVRVSLPPPTAGSERAFRVVVQQVPDRASLSAGRIVFSVAQSIPAFSEPSDLSPPSLSARLDGPGRIVIANAGSRRARITAIRQDGRALASGLVGYALGKSSSAFDTHGALHPGQVEIETDVGRRVVEVR